MTPALTVILLLVIAAFICTIVAAAKGDKFPLWPAVTLLCVIELIRTLPLGK